VIHANDACHMRMVLRKFPHARMIHDEFAGRAGERAELQRVTRDEFVRMYKGRQMVEGWDVEEVRNAKYFFD
jgi:DNA-directed RNA polymerase